MLRTFISALVVLWTGVGTAWAADLDVGYGPVRVGQPLDEIKALARGAGNETISEAYADGRPRRVRVQEAFEADGLVWDVDVTDGWYGGYELVASAAAETSDAAGCEAAAVRTIGDLESRYGAFQPPADVRAVTGVYRYPVSDSGQRPRMISTPRGSSVVTWAFRWEGNWTRQAVAGRLGKRVEGYGLLAERQVGGVLVAMAADWSAGGACILTLTFTRAADTPPPEPLPADRVRIAEEPSLAWRHWQTSQLPELPAEGLPVRLECLVSRNGGGLSACKVADPLADPRIATAALRWSALTTLALPAGTDPDDPRPYKADVAVTFNPSDARKIDPSDTASFAKADFAWERMPTIDDLERLYPLRARDAGVTGYVMLACLIEADRSASCVVDPDRSSNAEMFGPAALQISLGLRAPAHARNGSAPSGRLYRQPVDFRLSD